MKRICMHVGKHFHFASCDICLCLMAVIFRWNAKDFERISLRAIEWNERYHGSFRCTKHSKPVTLTIVHNGYFLYFWSDWFFFSMMQSPPATGWIYMEFSIFQFWHQQIFGRGNFSGPNIIHSSALLRWFYWFWLRLSCSELLIRWQMVGLATRTYWIPNFPFHPIRSASTWIFHKFIWNSVCRAQSPSENTPKCSLVGKNQICDNDFGCCSITHSPYLA